MLGFMQETVLPLGKDSPFAALVPELSSLSLVVSKLLGITEKSGSVLGHFPFESFPGLGNSSNRFGFAPTPDSFCLFASNGKGNKPTSGPAGNYGSGPSTPYYSGSSPAPYYNGNYNGYGSYGHYDTINLQGPAPSATFPYGLPPQLAYLLDIFGAELHCLLGPLLPASAPPFPVFLEVRALSTCLSCQHVVDVTCPCCRSATSSYINTPPGTLTAPLWF